MIASSFDLDTLILPYRVTVRGHPRHAYLHTEDLKINRLRVEERKEWNEREGEREDERVERIVNDKRN